MSLGLILQFLKLNRNFLLMSNKGCKNLQGRIIYVPLCATTHIFEFTSIFQLNECHWIFSSSGIGKPTASGNTWSNEQLFPIVVAWNEGTNDQVQPRNFNEYWVFLERCSNCEEGFDKFPPIRSTSLIKPFLFKFEPTTVDYLWLNRVWS